MISMVAESYYYTPGYREILPYLVAKLFPTLATPWTVARHSPLSMGFSEQEYESGLLFPSPGSFPNSGIEPSLLHWQVDPLPLSHRGSPAED